MSTDTKAEPAELITPDMIARAMTALPDDLDGKAAEAVGLEGLARLVTAAINAVAPLIAARAQLSSRIEPAVLHLIAAEREACAQIAEGTDPELSDTPLMICTGIAAAIRARGET